MQWNHGCCQCNRGPSQWVPVHVLSDQSFWHYCINQYNSRLYVSRNHWRWWGDVFISVQCSNILGSMFFSSLSSYPHRYYSSFLPKSSGYPVWMPEGLLLTPKGESWDPSVALCEAVMRSLSRTLMSTLPTPKYQPWDIITAPVPVWAEQSFDLSPSSCADNQMMMDSRPLYICWSHTANRNNLSHILQFTLKKWGHFTGSSLFLSDSLLQTTGRYLFRNIFIYGNCTNNNGHRGHE